MQILAFDPGEKHTGFAEVIVDTAHMWPPQVDTIISLDTLDWNDWQAYQHILNSASPACTVIIETWSLFPGSAMPKVGSHFEAIQVIGALRMLIWQNKLEYTFQAPSTQSERQWPASKLKEYGLAGLWKTPHERSALCHILYWCLKNTNAERSRQR